MPRTERNFEESFKNLKRDVAELKRNSQASMVGYVDNETGKIKDLVENAGLDARTPAAPVEIVVDQYTVESFNPRLREGRITMTFPPITKASDGTDISVATYQIWVREQVAGGGEANDFILHNTSMVPSLESLNVLQGKTYEVVARGLTSSGTPGLFSEIKTITMTGENAPPPIPSKLTLTERLGTIIASWNGLSFADELMPPDFYRTQLGVRWGEQVEYTPLNEYIDGSGDGTYGGAPFSQPIQVVHRSEDFAGNLSDWSLPETITLTPVVDTTDLEIRLTEAEAEIARVASELQTTGEQLNTKLDQARADITDHGTRLTTAEGRVTDAFVQIGSADSKATAAQAKADEAKADAATAAGIANGKGDVLIQSTAPATAMRKATTLWIDTTGGANTPKRWSGTAWVEVTDKAAKDAAAAAATADSKAQQAITDAAEAKAKAESAIRQSPSLLEWTADISPGNNTTQTKTPTEISYDGNQAASQYAHRFVSKSIPISPNRVYRIQAIVSNLGTAQARLQMGFYLNDANGSYVSSLWPSDSYTNLPVGATRIVATSTPRLGDLPANVSTASVAGYFLDSQPMVIHDLKLIDITDIISAQETADNALTMAGSKNTIFYSTNNPTGTANQGDVWRKVDSSKNVIAEWFWGAAGKWESSLVTTQMISNLDVGKLTAGTAAIADLVAQKIAGSTAAFQTVDVKNLFATSGTLNSAVIEKLWAEVVSAKKITTDMLAVGSLDNLVPDPSFENGGVGWRDDNAGGAQFVNDNTVARSGDWYLRGTLAEAGGIASMYHEPMIPIEAGAQYKAGLYYKVLSGAGSARVRIYEYNSNKNYLRSSISGGDEVTSDGWTRSSMVRAPLDDARYIRIRVTFTTTAANTVIAVDDVYTNRMVDNALIVTGGILAEHITASEAMSAKLGQFLKVTTSMLESNAVKAGNIDAGAVTAVKLDVDALNGKTLTGSVVRTSSASTRTEMNSTGIHSWVSGVKTFHVDTATGAVTATKFTATGNFYTGTGGEFIAGDPATAYFSMENTTGGGRLGAYKKSVSINLIGSLEMDKAVNSANANVVLASRLNSTYNSFIALRQTELELFTNYVGRDPRILVSQKNIKATMNWNGSPVDIWDCQWLSDDTPPRLVSKAIIQHFNSAGANMHIDAYGTIFKVSSSRATKLMIQDVEDIDEKLLSVRLRDWIDKSQAEGLVADMKPSASGDEHNFLCSDPNLRRIPGVIAEEVEEAGLGQFVTREPDGSISGVMYDRLGVALIPTVARLRDRVVALEEEREDILARLAALESATV